jgi:hypothetical protein
MTDMVEVPRWALDFVMMRASFEDAGPHGEGWPSDEMQRAMDALNAALNAEPENFQHVLADIAPFCD